VSLFIDCVAELNEVADEDCMAELKALTAGIFLLTERFKGTPSLLLIN